MICKEVMPVTHEAPINTPITHPRQSRGNEPIPPRRMPRILLASKSPRRHELLSAAGIAHQVIESGVDDGQLKPGLVSPEEWVAALAYMKAAAAASRRVSIPGYTQPTEPEVIVGADTVVIDDGEIIGQPRDRTDADRILNRLANGSHSVVTGIALIDAATGRRELFWDRAEVCVGPIPALELNTYLDSNLWQGKAGAYNLAERLSAGWPITYEGDPGTIMGLPMLMLIQRLESFIRSSI